MQRPKPAPRKSAQQNVGKLEVDSESGRKQTAWVEDDIRVVSTTSKGEIHSEETSFIISPSKEERSRRSKASKIREDVSRRKSDIRDTASALDISSYPKQSSKQAFSNDGSQSMGDPDGNFNQTIYSRPRSKRDQTDIASNFQHETTQVVPEERQQYADDSSVDGSRSQTPLGKLSRNQTDAQQDRRSADDSSVDGSRSQTPHSRSYRDRIRERIESVREKAGSSVAKAKSRSRLPPLHSEGTADETIDEEDLKVDEALQRREKVRTRWQEAAQGVKEVASADAAYDFFTQVWKEDEEPIILQPGSPQSAVEDITEDEETTKLTTADYLGLEDEWEIVQNIPAILTNAREIKSREEKLYFYPSSNPAPLEEKLPPEQEVRYLESEGIYVGNRLSVNDRNLNRLEHRLLASGGKKWFGEDAEVVMLPDPKREPSCKPILLDQEDTQLEFKPAVIQEYGNKMVIDDGNYLLMLHIISVRFLHHALFSREHVAAQRITELYKSYAQNLSSRRQEILAGRLEALRRARDSLKQSEDEGEQHMERLQRYVGEIKNTRQQYHNEARHNHQIFKQLISDWKDLLNIRATQGYTSTSLTLNLVDIDVDESEQELAENELSQWNEEVEREIKEVIEERQEDYNQQFDEYKRQLSLWKEQRRARRQAVRRRRQSEADDITEASVESRESPPEEVAEEPTPPSQPDLKEIRVEVTEMFHENFRAPSEPNIRLELSYSETVDSNPPSNKEQQRRIAIKRMGIFVKVLFNNREVCRSRTYQLGTRFTAEMHMPLQIQITELPENLKIQVYEQSSITSTFLAEVFVPIPGCSSAFPTSSVESLSFSSNRVVPCSHAGVGSGVSFTEVVRGEERASCLYTTGEVNCRVGWSVEPETGNVLAPPEKYLKHCVHQNSFGEELRADSVMDLERLSEWVEKTMLDPNDPRNAAFFQFVKNATHVRKDVTNYFRLDPLNKEFDFCTIEEIDNNPRFKLLHLRDQGEPEFRALRMIPNREKEIDKEIFKNYHKAHKSPEPVRRDSLGPLDSHRASGWRFLQEVRQRVARQCSLARQQRQLHDIILEDQVPDISTLGLTFMKWLQPKRPLRPKRKERKKVTVQNLAGQDVKVIVNIVRAFEVPVRKEVDVPSPGSFPTIVPVRPFVEVSFQGIVARTTAADGANPTWNQDLHLPLQPPRGDHSYGRIQEIQDCLYLHLFDETVVDLLEDDRMRDTNIHQRLERNWLGSLHIPFSTLYHNSRIEGTFKLYSPPVLLGYEREPQQKRFGSLNISNEVPLQRDATFLTLFITVQPALNPPEPFKEKLESSEMEYMEHHLDKWQTEMTSLFPHRHIKTLVLDTSGKAFCVTRFFRPQTPPVLDDDLETTDEMAARFVSMIPVVPGSMLFPGLFDIWLTSEQVLWCLSGDSEDIAVLLCCYFLYLEHPAWLLLGLGIPHGETAYVLTREGEHKSEYEYFIWDPATGQKYSVLDSFCPLQKVYCIINEDNIWANVQREELPRRTCYDVSVRTDWCPAFGRNVGAPNGSVQPSALTYYSTSTTEVLRLQDKLEKHLRDSLMKWRRTSKTLWNRYCIAILRKMLPNLEKAAWTASDPSTYDHAEELQEIQKSHKMCGFPINLPYTDMKALIEAVKATGVHYNENTDVEFALAVYIHPYPNNVLSVWVYVAALSRRR